MEFDAHYFEDEVREGFFVERLMKKAWAAQLEVLNGIDQICKKHGITYFADWGTLLGAVRHKGFIPWDDDLDICMKRADYIRFQQVAEQDFPEEYVLVSTRDKQWALPFIRVVNGNGLNFTEEHMKKYHNCPFAVGVDIFPLDYVPRNPEDEMMQNELMKLVGGASSEWKNKLNDEKSREENLMYVEEFCRVKIDREQSIPNQLAVLRERICQLYREEESDHLAEIFEYGVNGKGKMKKEWYDSAVRLPFENITIPVPQNYHECLIELFGEDYMTPKQIFTHDYPFYKKQAEFLLKKIKEERGEKNEDSVL